MIDPWTASFVGCLIVGARDAARAADETRAAAAQTTRLGARTPPVKAKRVPRGGAPRHARRKGSWEPDPGFYAARAAADIRNGRGGA